MKLENMRDSGLRWLWVSVIVLMLDRLTKHAVQKYLIAYAAQPVIPGFNLELSYNKGAAFSFLNHAPGWQVWLFGLIALVVTVVILIWLSRISYRLYWNSIALCFVVGGALGNLWDRISYGHVVDFIQLYVSNFYWPTFNIADSAICIGALMLVMHSIWE